MDKKHEKQETKEHKEDCKNQQCEEASEKSFESIIKEKDTKISELTDTLKRLQAEFENFRKRSDKDRMEYSKYAAASAIEKLLTIVDNFELAVKHVNDKEKFVSGMKMIYAQMLSQLESVGLKPIKAEGHQFDPYKHEVLLKEPSDKPEGTVLEELQKGYMFHDRVLRFSKVKVSGK